MRVTANAYTNSLTEQLNALASRQSRLQTQAATGQRIRLPEDDPAAMRRVLDLQAEAGSVERYQTNITRQKEISTATYGALKSLKTISDRAGEIATLADGLKSPEELAAYASEVAQLVKQAVGVANLQYNGAYLFAGTKSDQEPFVATFDAAQNITSVAYQGNATVPVSEISEGLTLSGRVPGANTTGAGVRGLFVDSTVGADVFSHLVSLYQHLSSGDVASIASTDRPNLNIDENNLLHHISHNGAIQARLEAGKSLLTERTASLKGQISNEVDVDLAQTLVQFNSAQNAYQAALQSGAKLFDLSLLNYLR